MSLNNRYQSLDVFRGMDVALMIIVNSLGSYETAWSPLLHAQWDGFTLTDLVFPTFLFVVGNSMCFSLSKYEGMGTSAVLLKIFKRTALIFLIGYLMYWFPFFDFTANGLQFRPIGGTRVFGVLQRIALCYGIAALIIHFGKTKAALAFSVIALLGYPLVLHAFGDLTMLGNIGTWLDRVLVGEAHMYKGEGVAFEPEGLLSTWPAVVNVLAGYLAAQFIRSKGAGYETLTKLMVAGCALLLAAQWMAILKTPAGELLAPINKKLWSSSYTLHTIGLDLLALPVVMYVIEMAGYRKWTGFFEIFGRNTLFIYLLSEVLVILLWWFPTGQGSLYETIYTTAFQPIGDHLGSFLFGVWVMLTCWVAGWWLDRRGIHIKV